jgi:hypothetical protein
MAADPADRNALFQAEAARVYRYAPDRSVVYAPSKRTIVLACHPAVEQVLALCAHPRPFAEHVQAVRVAGLVDSVDASRMVLDTLAAADLLRVLPSPVGKLPTRLQARIRHEVTLVGIVTADRPFHLRRCLRSLVAHCRRYSVRPDVIVVDGSKSNAARDANRQSLRSVRDGLGSARYVGRRAIRALRDAMVRAGAPADLVRFAIASGSAGANRNVLSLLTAGRPVVHLDDDVLCEVWTDSRCGKELVVADGVPWRERHFASREDARDATTDVDASLFELHGSLLGQTFDEIAQERPGRPERRLPATSLLDARARSAVRLTFLGVAGDAGVSCPWQSLMTGARRERVTGWSPRDLALALHSREVIRIAPSYVVTRRPWCMGYCMGVAGEGTLPPFSPVGRNEDGIFGATLGFIDSSALFGHLPFGVVHDSPRSAAFPRRRVPLSLERTRVADLLLAASAFAGQTAVPAEPAVRLRHLGRTIRHITELSIPAFSGVLTDLILRQKTSELATISSAASGPEGKDDTGWADIVFAYREAFAHQARRRKFFVPRELAGGSLPEGLARTKRFLEHYGHLLESWPALVRSASRAG